jgi:hypothetical protein
MMGNWKQRLREDLLKVGDMVFYRGKLARVESLEFEGRYCWLLNNDGDTYLVPQWDENLQNWFLRTLAESARDDFDF